MNAYIRGELQHPSEGDVLRENRDFIENLVENEKIYNYISPDTIHKILISALEHTEQNVLSDSIVWLMDLLKKYEFRKV